ncbi:YdcF family protein [Pontibacillus yanchengensis]|uniref:YdcF family protein n=1 Tax=Pontibacillus yanchengensis TaxID=462910 RepID=A0ACC7VJG2_9BACI|nr:YdcF family protein [Pontibacillus yanchengensis]MYL54927.1 YdcF family protein [Pontibacillus yanchengensis]
MAYPFDCITDFIFVETDISPADVILVPGADHPQLIEKAVALYKQGLAPYILPSGGYKPHVGATEWSYLSNIGIRNGVPEGAILKEDKAQHTLENARFSLEVLKQKDIALNKVIIVCKACHSRRALLCYQKVFPKEVEFLVSPVVDRYGITKDNWFLSEIGISRTMTEVQKIGKYFGDFIPNWVDR